MKQMGAALAILLVIFSSSLLHSKAIETLSVNLSALLEEAEANAEKGDWTGAKELTETARSKWEAKDLYLHFTLRHSETDAVYIGFREVTELIECQESGEYSAANAKLIAQLELLTEAEQLSLKNIF